MANLEDKFTELQLLLSSNHTELMNVLNDRLESIDVNTTTAASRLTTLATQSGQAATARSQINSNLIAVQNLLKVVDGVEFDSVADLTRDSLFALQAIAVSNAGNNTILQAIDATGLQTNRILEKLLLCGCNNGEPPPVGVECQGDYQRVTRAYSAFGAGIDEFATIRLDGNAISSYPCWAEGIGQETRLSFAPAGVSGYACNKSIFVEIKRGFQYCIENVGSQALTVVHVRAPSGVRQIEFFNADPAGFIGLNQPDVGERDFFAIVGNVNGGNPDGFKPIVFRETATQG